MKMDPKLAVRIPQGPWDGRWIFHPWLTGSWVARVFVGEKAPSNSFRSCCELGFLYPLSLNLEVDTYKLVAENCLHRIGIKSPPAPLLYVIQTCLYKMKNIEKSKPEKASMASFRLRPFRHIMMFLTGWSLPRTPGPVLPGGQPTAFGRSRMVQVPIPK